MERIKQMESYFDILKEAVSADKDAIEKDDTLKEYFQKLLQYYESAEWRHDYELDEKGLLPQDLKRGILSQDGFYNFIADVVSAEKELERNNNQNSL